MPPQCRNDGLLNRINGIKLKTRKPLNDKIPCCFFVFSKVNLKVSLHSPFKEKILPYETLLNSIRIYTSIDTICYCNTILIYNNFSSYLKIYDKRTMDSHKTNISKPITTLI